MNSSSPVSGSPGAAPDPSRIYTSEPGVDQTIVELTKYNLLIRLALMSKEDQPETNNARHMQIVSNTYAGYTKSAKEKRELVVENATGHCKLLECFVTFLQGKIGEIGKSKNLLAQLKQIEEMLRDRTIKREKDTTPAKRTEACSPDAKGSTLDEKSSALSKALDDATAALEKGWDRIRALAVFDAKLEALKNRFGFLNVEKYQCDEFAKENQRFDAVSFIKGFKAATFESIQVNKFVPVPGHKYDPVLTKKLTKVLQEIETVNSFIAKHLTQLKEQIEAVTKISHQSTEVEAYAEDPRVSIISTEFESHPLCAEVKKIMGLREKIAQLKLVVTIENQGIELDRPEEVRGPLHKKLLQEHAQLQKGVEELNEGTLIESLKTQQDWAEESRRFLGEWLQKVQENLKEFDEAAAKGSTSTKLE